MDTKVCTKCGIEKPLSEFHFRNKKEGIYRSECKACHSAYMKQIYKQKKEQVIDLKAELKCAKCGYNEYGVALDFHHLDPTQKDMAVARMTSNKYRIDAVMKEIKKCVCLCANCHRVFHFLEHEQGMTIEEFLA